MRGSELWIPGNCTLELIKRPSARSEPHPIDQSAPLKYQSYVSAFVSWRCTSLPNVS